MRRLIVVAALLTLRNRTDEATEQAVVDYAVAFPTHGQHRASNELRKQGVLSPTVVSVLSGYSITDLTQQ